MTSAPRLLLFTKIPAPGRVKTRLCPPLLPEEAAGLQEAFLRDILTQSLQLQGEGLRVELHYAGGRPEALPEWIGEHEGLVCRPQVGEDLGARMAHALDQALSEGAPCAVLRNTDSPLLPDDRIREAFGSLQIRGVDLVLGPDRGGGYYLVGLKSPLPGLFDLEALGSHVRAEAVLARSRAWALQQGLSPCLLREEGDVDEPGDLEELLARPPADFEQAPWTAGFLAAWKGRIVP